MSTFLRRPLFLFALSALAASPVFAAKPGKAEAREQKREAAAADAAPGKNARADKTAATSDPDSRLMTRLREQMEVTDDTEWGLIAERIKRVDEARRTVAAANARIPLATGDKAKSAPRAASAAPEQDALRSAVSDRLPDAEIKARLARAHEVYQKNESQLQQARAELRAVLTLRQEAVAVMAGLLPP